MFSVYLGIGAAICAMILAFKIQDWKRFSLFKRIIFILSIVIAFISFGFAIYEKHSSFIKEESSKRAGVIESNQVIYPRVCIRNSNVCFENQLGEVRWNENDAMANKLLPIPLLKLKVVNDRLFVDFVLRNSHGDILITIYENTWTLYSSEYEYNYDDHAIEVITKDHKVILQIEYLGDAAYFLGFVGFQLGGGGNYFKGFKGGRSGFILVGKDGNFEQYGEDVPKLFKYPRDLYVGVRNP